MANGNILFKSNINHLNKVRYQLKLSQKMSGSQVILSEKNQQKLLDATLKVEEAIKLLRDIT